MARIIHMVMGTGQTMVEHCHLPLLLLVHYDVLFAELEEFLDRMTISFVDVSRERI